MTIDERDISERFASLAADVTFRADATRLLAEGKRMAQRQRRRRVVIGSITGGLLTVALAVLVVEVVPTGDGPPIVHAAPSTSAPAGPRHVAPLADVTATPRGWSPVAYRSGQISVPSGWFIENTGSVCGQHDAGRVFVARSLHLPSEMDCGSAAAIVTLRSAGTAALPHETSTTVNGIAVHVGWTRRAGTNTWLERGLGLDVTATGAHAREVLTTLTHSPLSVLLHSSGLHTPASWRHVTFGGLRFAVPANWQVRRTALWGEGCGGMLARVAELSTARRIAEYRCPAPLPDARWEAGRPGLIVGAGPKIDADRSASDCRTRDQLRICVERDPQTVTAFITAPNQAGPVEVQVGLFGSGLTSATIFDSIEPAN